MSTETELLEIMAAGKYWFSWDEIEAATAIPVHKKRRQVHMEAIRAAMYHIAKELKPMSIRQMFYQLVSKGLIGKTEKEYKSTMVHKPRPMTVVAET